MMRRIHRSVVRAGVAGAALLALTQAGPASALATSRDRPVQAVADSYGTRGTGTLAVTAKSGLLANDQGRDPQLVAHSDPANGTVTVAPDGSFTYVPQAGFTGDDTFTYTTTGAARLYPTGLPPLGNIGGIAMTGGAYGSSLFPVPGSKDEFWGLTDRGPNVDLPDGGKGEPLPSFTPALGRFRLRDGRAVLQKVVPLRDGQGHPYSGLVDNANPTGETIEDLNGHKLTTDPNGYDPEGLAVLRDGTFWISDEYGPFITHFDSRGRALQRLSPVDGTLPAELIKRIPNKGMEGLTVTPDGRTLVGIMQSALQQTDLGAANAKNLTPLRIVTYDLKTHAEHEYVYLLDDPKTTGTAVSEITALSSTTFLVDERNGDFVGATGYKKLFKIDTSKATDVGPHATVAGAVYDASKGGLTVGGKSIELLLNGKDTAGSASALTAAGITPVAKTLGLDVNAFLVGLDPKARFFSHDKIEGVAAVDGGKKIVISNDSDFGVDGVTGTAPPYALHPKVSPATGRQDDGEFLVIDTTGPAATTTATVTIHVG
ncbi:esterase-like activity of phytase family protein [Actinomadura scrupuli]|uniref:esterase-like activity of phytase family protein n=1 Tax=Actinomadura scrupuli TaxID=559629 RepID=UPI003D99F2DC